MAQSDILFDANNRNQLFVLQFSSGEFSKFLPFMDELQIFLIDLVSSESGQRKLLTISGTRELMKEANDKVLELIGGQNIDFIDDFPDFAAQQAEFVEMSLNRAVIDYDALTPPIPLIVREAYRVPLVFDNSAFLLKDYIKEITSKTQQNVKAAIFNGYANGMTTQQIVAQIKGGKNVKGAIPSSKFEIERVVRTSLNHVATTSRQKTYKENKKLIIGYSWLSTLDSRTSTICRHRDGTLYLYDDKFNPLPPAHPFCRSTTVPELRKDAPLAGIGEPDTRSSAGVEGGKQVKASLNYYDWLKTQPASFQDEALGRTRGLIFRNSGLSIDEFKAASVGQFGKPLNLEQMRAKNKEIEDYLKSKE